MDEQLTQKLEAYRLRKRRKEKIDAFKSKLKGFFMLGTGRVEGSDTTIDITAKDEKPAIHDGDTADDVVDDVAELIPLSSDNLDSDDNDNAKTPPQTTTEQQKDDRWFRYALWLVYTALWTTLYIIAIELKFGIVFLMFSALFAIYFNTRTGPKKANEISAYSVFNKNCESIDGTLKAEQFEREIRYGSSTVR